MSTPCKTCQNWERVEDPYKLKGSDGLPLVTNHHPHCLHYNESLMDVWKVSIGRQSCYLDNKQDAKDMAGEEAECVGASITKIKMHREIFENLPEFDGF